jgi:hypothetical protein
MEVKGVYPISTASRIQFYCHCQVGRLQSGRAD